MADFPDLSPSRRHAELMARLALALLWLSSALLPLLPVTAQQGLAALAALGISPDLRQPAMLAGMALDLLFALLTLFRVHRVLWLVQIFTILAYTLLLTVGQPELWLHPFGPLTKNLPILALLYWLYEKDGR